MAGKLGNGGRKYGTGGGRKLGSRGSGKLSNLAVRLKGLYRSG